MTKNVSWAVCVISASAAWADDKDDVAEARRALDLTKVAFASAVSTAEREVPGGRVTEVELSMENHVPCYEVELLAGDSWKEVLIDGVNGRVLKVETDVKPDDGDDKLDIDDALQALAEANVTFEQARAAAARDAGDGQVVEVELTQRARKAAYKVKVVGPEKFTTLYVDATDGRVSR